MSSVQRNHTSVDLRKDSRTPARRPGWIAVTKGAPLRECFVWDESNSGARITVDRTADIPEVFFLYFSLDFSSRRKCRIAWRSDHQIGVEFVSESADPSAT